MILCYDGSLSGFFCLLGTAIKERLELDSIRRTDEQMTADLFNEQRTITTDASWAAKVSAGLAEKLGQEFMVLLAHALYSEEPGIERDILTLTGHALHYGKSHLSNPADPLVQQIENRAQRTSRERHKFLGLLRFRRLSDDSYLACCRPQTNIVPLLGSHFCQRFGQQRWIIIDEQRNLGLLGERNTWQQIAEIGISSQPINHASEEQLTALWRTFYHSVCNMDRYNPKLRQQFMPKQYWQYLTEMQPNN